MDDREPLTVREALDQLSGILEGFRQGNAGPVAIGSHRRREAVLVPAALWDALAGSRREAVDQTDASLRLEGLSRSHSARLISDSYIRGEIDVDEMVRRTVLLHARPDTNLA
ncbi:hypothetical protein F4553_006646 [Allocatelliglobosispora scoriae]|uniref:Antitoxin VbhA domain-containing protein n=1 Tax=Allocatelliglobosispora scoriae TaxID=643052 RepID=A0A841C2D4_9ACTN|nr:hypothetical protein [Allocatelliglobosispora scoriae]MBB5873212.1 hypothetical protein [Allocatelliglobosispora scoriae]